jgi:hypothetical protein
MTATGHDRHAVSDLSRFTAVHSSSGDIILAFRLAMIRSEPATTKVTMSTPNASTGTLFVLSGAVVMCRKKTR